jgi:hypothetical protein
LYIHDGINKVIKTLIESGANNLNECLSLACLSSDGHISIIKTLLSYGANDYDNGLVSACYFGKYKSYPYCKYENYLYDTEKDRIFMGPVKLMVTSGATTMNTALKNICSEILYHVPIAKFLIESGANNFNECLLEACKNKNAKYVKLLLESGANNYEEALNSTNSKQMKNIITKYCPKN